MSTLPVSVTRLIESLASLPGIGPKSASRLALYLIKLSDQELSSLSNLLGDLKDNLQNCSICQNISDASPCPICRDDKRANGIICVVEDALDVVAIERSGHFRGRYHVLQGVLSPIDGIGPDNLTIKNLEKRLKEEQVDEVILATNPTVEGEATALHLTKLIKACSNTKITRLAHGLPVGADLEYADEVTLAQALDGRRDFKQIDN